MNTRASLVPKSYQKKRDKNYAYANAFGFALD